MHRFVWDFRIAHAGGPLAAPGLYEVALVANRKTLMRPLRITRDPRVKASDADLVAQMQLATAIDAALLRVGKKNRSLSFKLYELESAVESADARPTHDQYALWASLRTSV
jgi:hypothetical protein